ncbi:MAG TPA: type II secretion system F family protein [Candidatus Acidoferrales bacterium]|nr:type II secretion system F family protein [Candidatus Acidoferrales bacterium]
MLIIIITVLFMASVFLFSLSLVPQRSEVSKRLEELEGLKWDPKTTSRSEVLGRVFSDRQRTQLQQQLMEAGWYKVSPAQIAARIIGGGGLGLSFGLALCALLQSWSFTFLLMTGMLAVGGMYLPYGQLKSAIKSRKSQLMRGLPDFLDMLASTVQAGLAFNGALGYAADVTTGALREEIEAVLSEIRLGRSRADALRSMAMRVRQPDISSTVTAIVQAERLGSNLGSVLNELAEETRNKRMMLAEEIAALMPVKMVIPMALFMLPALFVMIFGGVVARYMTGG